jgi:TRAP-type C4-dicarboxylate transport system substrate-binding protein
MKKLRLLMVLGCVSFLFTAVTLPATVCAKEIVLKWSAFLPKSHPESKSLQARFFDKVNERAKGELSIKWAGGPEVFSPRDLGIATSKGIVDISLCTVPFYQEVVPGVGAAKLIKLSPMQERDMGIYDYMNEHHKKHGMFYIGRPNPTKATFFYLYLNKKVTKPEDFKGLRIGAAGSGRPMAQGLGASVVILKLSEYYTAMERNLVDGINCVPLQAWVAWGCHEVTKYVIDHPYYQSTGMVIANLKSWNKMSKKLQDLVMNTMIEYEKMQYPLEIKITAGARQKMVDKGVEFYKLSPEVAKWYLDTTYDASWKYEENRFGAFVTGLKERVFKAYEMAK